MVSTAVQNWSAFDNLVLDLDQYCFNNWKVLIISPWAENSLGIFWRSICRCLDTGNLIIPHQTVFTTKTSYSLTLRGGASVFFRPQNTNLQPVSNHISPYPSNLSLVSAHATNVKHGSLQLQATTLWEEVNQPRRFMNLCLKLRFLATALKILPARQRITMPPHLLMSFQVR
jgi:hypothetical protein